MFRLKDWYLLGPAGLVAILLGWWGYMVCAAAGNSCPEPTRGSS